MQCCDIAESSLYVPFNMTDSGNSQFISQGIEPVWTPDLVLGRVPSFGHNWVFEPFGGCITVPLVFDSIGDGKLASNCGAFRADAASGLGAVWKDLPELGW